MKQPKLAIPTKVADPEPASSEDDSDSESEEMMSTDSESAGEEEAVQEEDPAPATGNDPSAFNRALLLEVADSMDPKSEESYKFTLKRLVWSEYAKPNLSEDLLNEMMLKLCKIVVRDFTLKELLNVAINNDRYLDKMASGKRVKRKRTRANGYIMFLRDYHKNYTEIPGKTRFKMCQEAYKKLSEEERRHYSDLAAQENLANLKAPKDIKPEKPKKRCPILKKHAKDNKEDTKETVVINSADHFIVKYKKKHGESNVLEANRAFAALSDKDRAKLIYKILQSVENDSKKPVLCKQDQVWLNKYEGRPQPPGTAYTIFMLEMGKDPEIAHLSFSQRATVIGGLWRKLDAAAKEAYSRKFNQKYEEYQTNYKKFLENLPDFRRNQETTLKTRKRRASVGEKPEVLEGAVVATATPAKRRIRSKTIDGSSAFKISELLEESTTMEHSSVISKKRKGETSIVNGESAETNLGEDTPKKVRKEGKKKKSKTVLSESFVEVPEDLRTPPPTPPEVQKKSVLSNGETNNMEVTSPKKAKKKKKASLSDVPDAPSTPPPVSTPAKSPIKEKKKKKEAKKQLPEPVKPPTSVKEYFKAFIYSGDPDKVRKAYKKVSFEDKERYHRDLTAISEKYAEDLNGFVKSLSKEELARYTERNNN